MEADQPAPQRQQQVERHLWRRRQRRSICDGGSGARQQQRHTSTVTARQRY